MQNTFLIGSLSSVWLTTIRIRGRIQEGNCESRQRQYHDSRFFHQLSPWNNKTTRLQRNYILFSAAGNTKISLKMPDQLL